MERTWSKMIIKITAVLLGITGFLDIVLGVIGRPLSIGMPSSMLSQEEKIYIAVTGLIGFLALYALVMGMSRLLLVALLFSALFRHIIPIVGTSLLHAELRVNISFLYNSILAWLALYSMGAASYEKSINISDR